MDHYLFFLINMLISLLVYVIDRRHITDYILLSALTLVLAYVLETITTFWGFWYYYSEPKIPLFSLYTWLMYIPYISLCYFIGNRFGDKRV